MLQTIKDLSAVLKQIAGLVQDAEHAETIRSLQQVSEAVTKVHRDTVARFTTNA